MRSYGFAQTDDKNWSRVSLNNIEYYNSSAKIICGSGWAELIVEWNSDSGDWAAVDTYSSKGAYFSRVIRFAQFDDTITVEKYLKNSSPVMKINGANANQYDYLLDDIKIWNRRSDVPFDFPNCADYLFDS